MSFRCPSCKQSDGLWEEMEVPGWRSVDESLEPIGNGGLDRDVEWHHAESTHQFGCSCGFGPAHRDALEALGVDGEPLPSVHRDQLTIEAA